MSHPLVEEAGKKAAIAWVAVGDGPAYALWCLPQDGRLHVVLGPGEQSAPGLAEAAAATVTLRGDHGGAVVAYPAAVERITPEDERWASIAVTLAGKRLNAPGTAEALAARWAQECVLLSLAPAGEPAARGDGSERAEPRPTPAANATRKPFRLHRVRRR
ncbi:hypothetical protein QEZ54_04250 [Catellatospora sp. KI3]|uniref:hypothetical protein n=1 Tax=Catellatospora sp. KI3 TaxID=3041620 RepID=UPI002482329B|nr:hypothetical protein [Catellatospora sp. KI3]MDI1460172.1 hypothetical protein [Catellatospora sp. KI3]